MVLVRAGNAASYTPTVGSTIIHNVSHPPPPPKKKKKKKKTTPNLYDYIVTEENEGLSVYRENVCEAMRERGHRQDANAGSLR